MVYVEENLKMKKSFIIIIIITILVILGLFSVIVFAKTQQEEPTLEEKVMQEIKYLNNYTISLLGYFNDLTVGNAVFQSSTQGTDLEENESNVKELSENNTTDVNNASNSNGNNGQNNNSNQSNSSSETQNNILQKDGKYKTNWTNIKQQIEELYQTWNTISLDLHALNIENQLILDFNQILNNATQYIKDEDKIKSMKELLKLYQLLPQYLQSFQPDSQATNIMMISSNIVAAYVNTTADEWDEAGKQLDEAEQKFSNLLNSVTVLENQVTMNQSYILVNELKQAVNLKDKDIFYIQYQNLMPKMGLLF